MRNRMVIAAVVALVAGGLLAAVPASAGNDGKVREYVVLYDDGASAAEARAAIGSLDGVIVEEITQIGLAKVRTSNDAFEADVAGEAALAGAAPNRIIGYAEPALREKVDDVESLVDAKGTTAAEDVAAVDAEPLAGLQWDMEMIDATVDGSYAVDTGDPDVLVGIIDTGIDASHPDIAPNFDATLSRNFTIDDPVIDGTCASDPDGLCTDPANVDEAGHGTHVSGTVAAALNGLGIAGIAPDVTLVNLQAGQDSGFFFLFETLQAYIYAANNGIDVVNMSYFTDPWWANCRDNPLDTPLQQQEQETIIDASNLALNYAYNHGVTLIAAEGNEHTDLGNPTYDAISPDYPPGTSKIRNITNDCLVIPTEGDHVISVSSLGPSGRKSYFSNYGLEQTVVSAPGGDRRDFFGTPQYNTPGTRILSTYPMAVAIEDGLIGPGCTVLNPLAVVDTSGGGCAVYVYLQGTSMASPHAVGVAALIIGAGGTGSGAGFGMSPVKVEKALRKTATDTDAFFAAAGEDWRDFCPVPPTEFIYPDLTGPTDDPNVSFDAICEGNHKFNGFYGDGVVNALAAANS